MAETTATRIQGGIEWCTRDLAEPYRLECGILITVEEEASCARCGSSAEFLRCSNCGGEGYSHHDCGEDTCCCLYPEDNVVCSSCDAEGGTWHCISTPAWCEANPLPGRESITSTALRAEAWADA